MKQALEGRIDLSAQYLEFHEKAVQLAEQLDVLEDSLRTGGSVVDQQEILDARWTNMQQLFKDLKNLGHGFIVEAKSVS